MNFTKTFLIKTSEGILSAIWLRNEAAGDTLILFQGIVVGEPASITVGGNWNPSDFDVTLRADVTNIWYDIEDEEYEDFFDSIEYFEKFSTEY